MGERKRKERIKLDRVEVKRKSVVECGDNFGKVKGEKLPRKQSEDSQEPPMA